MYILFSIISPVIEKITGGNLKITNEMDLDKYIEVSNNEMNKNEEYMMKNKENINNIYIDKIKMDISEKIENKGYKLKNIDVNCNEKYEISKINVEIKEKIEEKNKEKEQNKENKKEETMKEINCKIEEVELIQINNEEKNKKKGEKEGKDYEKIDKDKIISDKEKTYLKKYLSNTYNVNIKNIFINE